MLPCLGLYWPGYGMSFFIRLIICPLPFMNKTIFYLSLLFLTQCSKCKTDDPAPKEPQLPAETQSGQRILGGRANGIVFSTMTTTRVNSTWACSGFCLDVNGSVVVGTEEERTAISLSINGDLSAGNIFPMVNTPPSSPTGNYGAVNYTSYQCDYEATRLLKGQVILTRFDPVERIAAGRFSFTLYKPGCDTLRVTDGRFDVRF